VRTTWGSRRRRRCGARHQSASESLYSPPPNIPSQPVIKAIMKRAFALYSVFHLPSPLLLPYYIPSMRDILPHGALYMHRVCCGTPLLYIDFRRQDGYCRMLHIHLETQFLSLSFSPPRRPSHFVLLQNQRIWLHSTATYAAYVSTHKSGSTVNNYTISFRQTEFEF
jgi:hypothetical protein